MYLSNMKEYIYIYIYILLKLKYTYIYILMYLYMCTYILTYLYTYMYILTYIYVSTYKYTHVVIYILRHICIYISIYIYICGCRELGGRGRGLGAGGQRLTAGGRLAVGCADVCMYICLYMCNIHVYVISCFCFRAERKRTGVTIIEQNVKNSHELAPESFRGTSYLHSKSCRTHRTEQITNE